jgi:hypothetical protein
MKFTAKVVQFIIFAYFEKAYEMTLIPSYHESLKYVWDYIVNGIGADLYLINEGKNA